MNFSSSKTIYIVGAVVFFLVAYSFFFSVPEDFPTGTIVSIKDGSGLRSISKYLEENHIIRSRVVFETFVIILGGEKHLVIGSYLFESRVSVFEVARRISNGERHLAPVKVTIPEGFNVSDIAKAFSLKLPHFDANKFLVEADKKEGYLFPDTYFFLTTDTEQDVLHSMSDNFEKKILPIKSEIFASGKSEKDIMIMASLIEKESKGDMDRAFISGILWRRIRIGMPLQVDAEPNTYKTKGLPASPICNPGIKAIEASIHPRNSSYLYYLHDKDGNIHYAETFAQHVLNKQKYLK
ncbi:MAG: endolytic transglycosylase MltG [Candidatus Paceibacterota bacterium]